MCYRILAVLVRQERFSVANDEEKKKTFNHFGFGSVEALTQKFSVEKEQWASKLNAAVFKSIFKTK